MRTAMTQRLWRNNRKETHRNVPYICGSVYRLRVYYMPFEKVRECMFLLSIMLYMMCPMDVYTAQIFPQHVLF